MDLRKELDLRRTWLYETQLRRLNTSSFRDVTTDTPGALLDLLSEERAEPPPLGSTAPPPQRVQLDSGRPVWNAEELARRGQFPGFIGRVGDWLNYAQPTRLIAALAELRKEYEGSRLAGVADPPPRLSKFSRQAPVHDGAGRAVARAELATAKPWLIPELYAPEGRDTTDPVVWVECLERFLTDQDNEQRLAAGARPRLIEVTRDEKALEDFKKIAFAPVDESVEDLFLNYTYAPALQTEGFPMGLVKDFPHSGGVKYWMKVFHDPLREVVALKPNSDMGLCHVVRLLYLYAPLPRSLGTDGDLTWRRRPDPDDERLAEFFELQSKKLAGNAALQHRLRLARGRLTDLLRDRRANPRAASPVFSPLAASIVKHGLLSYKFWLDEPLRAKGNTRLSRLKQGLGITDANDIEMEFWSENHYIMYASSEYLLGQLWADDDFQPGGLFLEPGDDLGVLKGRDRLERGRARVLKWLNNRLMFGWMEFNSAGYYREHLWALVNLVDFALDEEVRTKAAIAVDLLLFDVVRFLHKGTMGAPGGRSQFKSRNCGWDNALNDVVELMLGSHGIHSDADAQIGCMFASSGYVVPEVLLEIGVNPPRHGFTDRTRVSITFDEAPKYGIHTSMRTDARDSLWRGYQSKRDKYFPFIASVNDEISRTHPGYGAVEDDTVFFWGMSAFFNKQIVRQSLATVDKFGLENSPAFVPALRFLIETLLPLIRRGEGGFLGGLAGAFLGGMGGMVWGAVGGILSSDILGDDLEADAADDLSVFTEGSTRTRANIMTFRNPDVMLSTIQNFRTGQLNFQSTVNQVSLNAAVNVFTTSGFSGMDISPLWAAAAGAVAGAAVGMPVVGAVVGMVVNETEVSGAEIGDDLDGPSWWTGSWALPMVAQSGSAAILVYDFHDIQDFLTESGSHVWFPKAGFDRVVERRTSAYDNADFFLLDIGDIGPKGFWLFGRVVHPVPAGSTEEPREGYVGVFSNQRPEWLDRDFDLLERKLAEKSSKLIKEKRLAIEDKLDELEDEDNVGYGGRQVIEIVVHRSVKAHYRRNISRDDWLNAVKTDLGTVTKPIIAKRRPKIEELAGMYIDWETLHRIWKEPFTDFFADRDWFVEGKNIWILQVGSKEEFGSFENFMDRVSSARLHIDDAGDMECSYDIPKPGGGHDRLSVAYGDRRFGLNGGPHQTDLYPRFENPFVRGGKVEWGQREYCLEWNGKTLLHDFSDFTKPKRTEAPVAQPGDAETVRALVIYLATGDEEMEEFTVATVTVDAGCERVTGDQVVAAGPVGEGAHHDAEWIFFDRPSPRHSDLSFTMRHTGFEDDDPEWKASFSVKALMGDRTLRDCALSFTSVHFEDERRQIGPMPLVVKLSAWAPWALLPEPKPAASWVLATHPPYSQGWQDFHDLVVTGQDRRLWHRRLTCGATRGDWEPIDAPGTTASLRIAAATDSGRGLNLYAVEGGALFTRYRSPQGWAEPWVRHEAPVGLVSVTAGDDGVYAVGVDGNVYFRDLFGQWRDFETDGFTPAVGVPVRVAGRTLMVLGSDGVLRSRALDPLPFLFGGGWEMVSPQGLRVGAFALGGASRVAVRGPGGAVSTCVLGDDAPLWTPLAGPVAPGSSLGWANPSPGRWWLVATGIDGVVRAARFTDGEGAVTGWEPIGAPDGRPVTRAAAGIAVACRAEGQFEVFAETVDGALARTWWS